jgi:NAD(P)H-dependent FMN reductase
MKKLLIGGSSSTRSRSTRLLLYAGERLDLLASIDATDAQVQWSEKEGLSIEPDIARRINDGVDALSAGLVAQCRFF